MPEIMSDDEIICMAMNSCIAWTSDEGRPDAAAIIDFARSIIVGSGGSVDFKITEKEDKNAKK